MPPRCNNEINCPAAPDAHNTTCPWHTQNVGTMIVSDREFESLLEELDRDAQPMPRLTQLMQEESPFTDPGDELRLEEHEEVDRIVAKVRRGVDVTAYTMGLFVRYDVTRWQMIMDEAKRRLKETPRK